MLTLANFNTTQAKTYYKQENYYSQEEAQANSQWQGKGAAQQKLHGAIADLDAYHAVVDGLSPDGKTKLRQKQNHKNKFERAGVDLTFSAPKSVSIACLVGGDKRLESAHRCAVSRTLDLIESRYAATRINGQKVKTGNLVVAKWHHDTSRELDPHLHTHCLVMNCTQSPDGKWRSLSNSDFYCHKILLGQIYRNELALECRKLGYEIEKQPQELFEIKGYTREQIEAFSKRHEQIVQYLKGKEIDVNTESKVWAWRRTRVKKNHEINRNEMFPHWSEEADLYGIVHPTLAASPQLTLPQKIAPQLQVAVSTAIEHCSEKKVAFTEEEILKFITAEIKPYSIDEIEQAIRSHPELVKTFDKRFTTPAALSREIATIKLMQQGKGQSSPIASVEEVESYLQAESARGKRLTRGQTKAVELAVTTNEQFIAWCGVAGAGKTHSLRLLKEIAQAQEYTVRGFAPSGTATKVLGKELGIKTDTVASLLLKKQPRQIQPRQLWIVDEAGLLNAKDGYKLLQRAQAEQAQVILVGDYRQSSAVEAGSPFRSLLSAGISTAYMNESLRQKTPELKIAADLAAAGNHAPALNCLRVAQKVEQIPLLAERTRTIAVEYLKLTPAERCQTLVLAGTHKEKSEIMRQIRSGLKQEGLLSAAEIQTTKLRQRQELTSVQARYAHNYQVGDVVMPVREYKRLGLHKFALYHVAAIEVDKLLLHDLAGNQKLVDPMQFRKQVYRQHELSLAVGDRLKWTQGNRELGYSNGDEFAITGLVGNEATIEYEDGKTQTLSLNQPLHLDYAIVSTTYSSQGKAADRVLVSSTVDPTVNQESTYVAITRTRYDLKIFAEDIDFLMVQAQESKVQQNPLELLGQAEEYVPSATTVPVQAAITEIVSAPPNSTNNHSPPHAYKSKEIPQKPLSKPIQKSRPNVPFWTPGQASEPPAHIHSRHWRELAEGSAIDPALAASNIRSLGVEALEQEHAAWEYLMYSDKLERTNAGRLAHWLLRDYAHIENGGWWAAAGVDARCLPTLTPGEQPQLKPWGCFKPDTPRLDADKSQRKGKPEFVKYEHPPKMERQLFLFNIPDALAERIYAKYGIQPTAAERQSGFWFITHKYNLPVTVAEGAKKTLSSLSQGEITIGISGVNGGYFANDPEKNRLKRRRLHPELEAFATPNREFRFALDADTKAATVWNVRRDLVRTGELLEQAGCRVRVVQWSPEQGKGLDDLIINQGARAYAAAMANSIPLAGEAQKHYRGEYSKLAKKVRSAQPTLTTEAVDLVVYQLAVQKGDRGDGARTIAQSDAVRSFQASLPLAAAQAETNSYIEQIQTLVAQQQTARADQTRQNTALAEPAQLTTGRESETQVAAANDGQERVRIQTQRQEASQWHGCTGVVVGRIRVAGSEQVIVQVGNYTPGFDRSELVPLQPQTESPLAEQTQSLTNNSPGQQSTPVPNPSQLSEQTDDTNTQIRAELATSTRPEQRHRSADRKDRPIGSQPTQTDSENWFARGQPLGVEATTHPARSRSERKRERVESDSRRLLAAISGYLKQQEAEQLGAAIGEVYHRLAERGFPSRGAATRPDAALSTHSASIDSTASNRAAERQTGTGVPARQCLEAIAGYLTAAEVESALLSPSLEALADKFRQNQSSINSARVIQGLDIVFLALLQQLELQHQQTDELPPQAITAIAEYLSAQTVETALAQSLEGLKPQFSVLSTPPIAAQTLAVAAIAKYLNSKTVETTVAQSLAELEPQLFLSSMPPIQSQTIAALAKHAVRHIADWVVEDKIESTLLSYDWQTLANNLQHYQLTPAEAVQLLETAALTYSALAAKQRSQSNAQAIAALSDYLNAEAMETALVQALDSLTQQLSQTIEVSSAALAPEQLQLKHRQLAETIASYLEQEAIESSLDPQTWQIIIAQLQQLPHSELSRQLQVAASAPAVAAICNYCTEAALAHTIAASLPPLLQQLSLSADSPLPQQLQQLSSAIESYCQQLQQQPQTPQPTPPQGSPKLVSAPDQEQPVTGETETLEHVNRWQQVVQALGKDQEYIDRVAAIAQAVREGISLPEHTVIAMQRDFKDYLKLSDNLLCWYQAAQTAGKSEQYLSLIAQVSTNFHSLARPVPLSQTTLATMQQDLQESEQLQIKQLWQHYSQQLQAVTPSIRASAVAYAALKDGHSPELVKQLLLHDPILVQIRQRTSEQAAQNHLRISWQSAVRKMQRHSQSQQTSQQRQPKHNLGHELS